MNVLKNGKISSYKQNRYGCGTCGTRGRFKVEFSERSRCLKCSSDLVIPLPDFVLHQGVPQIDTSVNKKLPDDVA